MATASDTAKEIYAVLADDDMTPAQQKKVIDAATRKAQAIDEKTKPEGIDTMVEQRVEEELQNAWGMSPIRTSKTKAQSEEEYRQNLMDRIAKGDMNAYLEATFNPPPLPR
jgi:hypothetical protein